MHRLSYSLAPPFQTSTNPYEAHAYPCPIPFPPPPPHLAVADAHVDGARDCLSPLSTSPLQSYTATPKTPYPPPAPIPCDIPPAPRCRGCARRPKPTLVLVLCLYPQIPFNTLLPTHPLPFIYLTPPPPRTSLSRVRTLTDPDSRSSLPTTRMKLYWASWASRTFWFCRGGVG